MLDFIGSKCLKCKLKSDPEVFEAIDFLLQNVLGFIDFFGQKSLYTPHPAEPVGVQCHRCRSLGLGQKAIFICVIRLIPLISRSAVLDYPGSWDFLGTRLATQGHP